MTDKAAGATLEGAVVDKILRQLESIQATIHAIALAEARAAAMRQTLLERQNDHENRIR
jgi:hypothetical protein